MGYSNPAGYNQFMGRWSAELAPRFLRFAQIDGQRVLDVGCGTGMLTRALLAAGVAGVDAIDPEPAFLDFARSAVADGRARFRRGSAEAIGFANGTFDAVLALLVLQDVSDPAQAVREMARVTRPGGRVATAHWDFDGGLPMLSLLWSAADAVAPTEVARRRAATSARQIQSLQDLHRLWEQAGLVDIRSETLDIAMRFESFDDYWQPFLAGATPTSAFAATLDRQTGGALERALRSRLPAPQADGSITLPARAWAAVGVA